MAQFIHLTDERLTARIVRSGIKPHEEWGSKAKYVFATPIVQDFST